MGGKIKVEEWEVGLMKAVSEMENPSRPLAISCLRAPDMSMGVEVFLHYVVTTGVDDLVESGQEIGWTGKVKVM